MLRKEITEAKVRCVGFPSSLDTLSRYVLTKIAFKKAQRTFDMLWSSDAVFDSKGDLQAIRLNSNFFRRPEVRRQLEAAKRKR